MEQPVVIVGMGEVGTRFAHAAEQLHMPVRSVTRERGQEHLDGPAGTPIVVTVREPDLPAVLARIPPSRGADLVVVQNGFIDELLAPFPELTRAILWFTSKGTFFADLLQSPVRGPRADLVRALINGAGGSAESITDEDVFRRYALEKAVWSCVVGAPLTVWGVDLATARHEKMGDVHAIVDEACAVVRVALGAEISPQRVMATIDDTSKTVGWMRGGTKSVAWRNGKVVEWGERCGIPTPVNRAIVEAAEQGPAARVTEVE